VPPERPTRHALTAAALLATLVWVVAGCSSSSSSTPAASPPSSSSTTDAGAPPTLRTTVVLGKVAGNLHQPNRRVFAKYSKHVQKNVGKAVDAWFDGAFVGVDYPRRDFPDAFSSFTSAARRDARRQQQLMTNWKWRHDIDGVTTTKRKVVVDVLAPHGHPAGATARVDLQFKTSGHVRKKVTVTGRLFLSRDPHGTWRIFGYDVSKGAK
jgi:hypothetical protein